MRRVKCEDKRLSTRGGERSKSEENFLKFGEIGRGVKKLVKPVDKAKAIEKR